MEKLTIYTRMENTRLNASQQQFGITVSEYFSNALNFSIQQRKRDRWTDLRNKKLAKFWNKAFFQSKVKSLCFELLRSWYNRPWFDIVRLLDEGKFNKNKFLRLEKTRAEIDMQTHVYQVIKILFLVWK